MTSAPTIAILAGGLATRMGELTATLPKSLLDIGGRPFLAFQLELIERHGVRDVVICTGHFGEQIEEWCHTHAPRGVRIRFSRDGDTRLGTGGALRKALPLLGESFLVMYGDSYLQCDYGALYRYFVELAARASEPPLGLMTVFENADQFDSSNVVFADGRIVNYDKQNRTPETRYIDWGLGVLTQRAFEPFRADDVFDLATVYQRLVSRGLLAGYEVRQRFFEVGSRAGLDELRALLAPATP
jgi:N-acetyl-alpha-D-muramate 1-phosphate uridylyltransferase